MQHRRVDSNGMSDFTPSINHQKPYAIVIALDCMTGLQTARILARHGVPVIGIVSDPAHYCARTRVPEHIAVASTETTEFVDLLTEWGPAFAEKPILVPCSDLSVHQISLQRDMLAPHYRFALPAHETVEMLMDKVQFYEFARQHALPIPPTFLLRNRSDAENAARELTFPAVFKPPLKTPLWMQHSKEKVLIVSSAEELLATYDRCSAWADVFMVQDHIPGTDADLYSCNCYFDTHGQPLVTFIARKLRQWPPGTGTSCLGEEIRNDVVLEESLRLFYSAGYFGLGYVEMKRDPRTGRHYIIEPNVGRPTGRSAIAEAGGVELLYSMYCDLVGLPLPEGRIQTYKGVKWISLRRDIQSAIYYWRRGELSLRDWLTSLRGKKAYAVFSWTDPAPFVYDLINQAKRLRDRP